MSQRYDRRKEDQEWRTELNLHRNDSYAHGALVGRLTTEGGLIRDRYDERLEEDERRISKLEAFKSQATLLGAIGFSILGAVVFAVAERFIVHGIP